MSRWLLCGLVAVFGFAVTESRAGDWVHWRGPDQTGHAKGVKLPDEFGVTTVGKDHLLWKQPFGGRSAPLVLNGRLFTISGYDMSLPTEGERVMCFDAESGKVIWEKRFNVFHTDIVSSRLGWTTMTADPASGNIFAHTTGGYLLCLDKDGKEVWKRQLTEEYGRVTGYGGRIVSPVFDDGLVIVGMVNGSWGDQARGNNRFVAFDAKTGEVVWWSSPTEDLKNPAVSFKGTYYSNPVVTTINGQRILITGGADGCVHAMKVRTGERVWSHHFSAGVVNPSIVVDGNLVFACHGEENPEGGPIGRAVCLDASKVDPKTKKPMLVWENKKLSKRFGLASPALADGRLYVPDDASELVCFQAKTGKVLWRTKYGTVSRGAPLIADGKLYIFDVNAKLAIFKLNGDKEPEELDPIAFRKEKGAGFVETHGTPIAVNDKLYFLTQDQLYCVGDTKGATFSKIDVTPSAEPALNADADPVHKVTIIPRGRSLGVTHFLPEEDRVGINESQVQAYLDVGFGGRAAERLVFDELTAGAAGDLKSATRMARMMVTQWGMSERVGPVFVQGSEEHPFLGREMSDARDHSEHTAQVIDEEISRILREAEARAYHLLEQHRDELEKLTEALIEREVLTVGEIEELIGKRARAPYVDEFARDQVIASIDSPQ